MSEKKKAKKSGALPLILLAVVAGIAWGGFREDGWFRGTAAEQIAGAKVRRGPLLVTVSQRGHLGAKNSAKVVSEMEGRNPIIWLIEEGTTVKPGDLVAELDSAALEDRIVEQDISLDGANASMTKAEQELEIQKSQNFSDFEMAKQKLELAERERKKYVKGDWVASTKKFEEEILKAQADATQAEDNSEWTKKLFEAGFETETKKTEDEIRATNANIALEQRKRDKQIGIDHTHPMEMLKMDSAVAEAERELERVELQNQARLVDKEQALRSTTTRYELEQEKTDKLRDQFSKTRLIATADGIVVYSREEGSWRGDGEIIREGTEVRERQELLTIPQAGGMIAEASLHESVIKKVKSGMPATIRVDAIPGQEFDAAVSFVALLPDKGSRWSNPDLRVFRTTVEIINGSVEMRPDMSCQVEILVEQIDDTLFVPMQAVFPSGGGSICFVDGEAREVETGQSTNKWIQILSGVEEGETVWLSAPTGFVPEPAPEAERDPESPGDGAQGPSGAGQMPGGAGQMPGGAGQMPGGAGQMPAGAGQRPEGTGKMPGGAGKKPPGTGRPGGGNSERPTGGHGGGGGK